MLPCSYLPFAVETDPQPPAFSAPTPHPPLPPPCKALGWGWGGRAAKARATREEAGGWHWPGRLLCKLLWGQGQPLGGRGDQTAPGCRVRPEEFCPLRCQPEATTHPRTGVGAGGRRCLLRPGVGVGGSRGGWASMGCPSSTPGRTPSACAQGLRARATWFLSPRSQPGGRQPCALCPLAVGVPGGGAAHLPLCFEIC